MKKKRQKIKHFLIMIKRGNQIELFVRAAEKEREKERKSKQSIRIYSYASKIEDK